MNEDTIDDVELIIKTLYSCAELLEVVFGENLGGADKDELSELRESLWYIQDGIGRVNMAWIDLLAQVERK